MIYPIYLKLPTTFLTNKPFSLERRICTIVKTKNVNEKLFKELKKQHC